MPIAEITQMVGKESVHTKTDSAPELSNSQEACGEGMQPTTQGRQATEGYKKKQQQKKEEIMENDDDKRLTGGIIGKEGTERNVWEREELEGTMAGRIQSVASTKYAHHHPAYQIGSLAGSKRVEPRRGKTLRPVSNVPVVPSKWPGRALPCVLFLSTAPVAFPHFTEWCTYTTATEEGVYVSWWTTD
ncbi:uncharacterized protein BO88DRAFT_424251 [Aspergillus vadensis CBS 113365]|uniref:Uncharacterized protein n=1 Tax=Aspergillus vadensis (strain CBS 113365 / IMI 142717 / IBT 24658) TaxID=1448311 RepID=A0A319BIH2_ASPVC|nr:hypothetical protein BO88DRAFT_424251 [Aspergillus vadensis CBS 113365]PYH70690.1 hypothetical protein BO88DRAFT_424251 [Aspergillus vadensis CBS 113365]